MDLHNFYTGNCFDAYEYLGVHKHKNGFIFRVFAPNAKKVSLIGDFNNWTEEDMTAILDGNFYELFIPNAKTGMKYLHRIYKETGGYTDHCDIYGYAI